MISARASARLLASQTDERLVELVAQGSELAFEAIVARYRRALLRQCGRMGLSEARSEDVVQHALLHAWLALEQGTEVRDLRAWLYRIAHNTAIDNLRRAAEQHGPLATSTVRDSAQDEQADAGLAVRATLSELAALPKLQREAILMSAVEGRSYEEVAGILGVSEGAVRGLLHRARITLRAAVAGLTPSPLLSLAAGGGGSATPSLACVAQLSACTPPGAAGTLARGAAIALSAAAVLVTGVAVEHTHGGRSPRQAVTALAPDARAEGSFSRAAASTQTPAAHARGWRTRTPGAALQLAKALRAAGRNEAASSRPSGSPLTTVVRKPASTSGQSTVASSPPPQAAVAQAPNTSQASAGSGAGATGSGSGEGTQAASPPAGESSGGGGEGTKPPLREGAEEPGSSDDGSSNDGSGSDDGSGNHEPREGQTGGSEEHEHDDPPETGSDD